MKLRKKATFGVAALLVAGSLVSCTAGGGEREAIEEFPESWDETITIDVFDGLANYMGIQQGWFAKLVEDKFNMKLNIIAPNVAGGGDTLFNTRVAAGDLGDLIITDKGERLTELVEGGLLMDATPYLPAMEHVSAYKPALDYLNDGKDGVFGFPSNVSSLSPTEPSEGLEPIFGAYVRWDYYKELGYPEIDTVEDLLPILADMQAAHPTADNGNPTYAFSLFKDWDGNMMVAGKQTATFYGYDELGFALARADGSDFQSILDPDSEYMRNLELYFEANQLGLLDPESTTQNYDTVYSKYQNGQVLFSWWPWLAQAAYNTDANTAEGKGFMMAPVADQKSYSVGAEIYGGGQVFAIGSKAEDPERIAAFVDWLYSPEGAYVNSSQVGASSGPQGLTWDVNDAGEPELTEFGREVFLQGGGVVPEEWGGGNYADGVSALNLSAVVPVDVDPSTGLPYSYTLWPTYQESIADPLSEDWSAAMGGAASTMDYLKERDQILVATGASFTTPADSSEIETLRNQIKEIIKQFSWQMVSAESESQFDSLRKEMIDTANGLGYEKVLSVDMDNAQAQADARSAVAEEFGD
ncbi:extracellular solute-binding protein [Microbacterium sp. RU33B]|uniref:extracellular solute-binding protein n=1 Tax=Microbacterium sp. RU33B TaxID=1907390 RepID=UPI00095F84BF|nr:extracellular solute-binding protein [Microbacterium sp. RU33B]SIT66613.1 carbohydrate ABC transporter substrate-binding protein, CUT1 family [Microbacterium sp. RU33B]